MAQFDVHKNPRGTEFPLLLDLQADVVASLATRIVVPMARRKRNAKLVTRVQLVAPIAGAEYVLHFAELAAIPAAALGPCVGSLAGRRAELIAALDWLITGS
jgi:toxin CcdB